MSSHGALHKTLSAAGLVALACSAHPGDDPKLTNPAERCTSTLAEHGVEAADPEEPSPRESQLVVRAELPEERLRAEIEGQVPLVLAQEKNRPIGAPGRVTYVVKRGAVIPSIENGTLRVAATAHADISVCKPLGPLCVGYGSCQPVFVSTVDLPLALTADYGWQAPSASIQVTQGCRIAMYDATPRIRSIAESNLGTLKSRVASSLPALRPGVAQVWKLLTMPVFLNQEWCLHLTPRGLVQGPATQGNGRFELSAALNAEVSVQRNCEAGREAPELPPLTQASSLPDEGTLTLSEELSTEDLNRQLGAALEGDAGDGESISRVQARPARLADDEVLLIGLTLDGKTCGTAWFRADVVAVAADRLKLSRVEPLSRGPEKTLALLAKHVEKAVLLKPELSFAKVREALATLLGDLTQGLTGGVRLKMAFGPVKPLSPAPSPAGLRLSSSLELAVVAKLE